MTRVLRWACAFFFAAAGANHFRNPAFYESITPPFVPAPLPAVYATGALEILFAALLLVPRTRPLGKWGLLALLAAVFPANVWMALRPDLFPMAPGWLYWARLPVQLLLAVWVWKSAY